MTTGAMPTQIRTVFQGEHQEKDLDCRPLQKPVVEVEG